MERFPGAGSGAAIRITFQVYHREIEKEQKKNLDSPTTGLTRYSQLMLLHGREPSIYSFHFTRLA